jgi:hypothetical protein
MSTHILDSAQRSTGHASTGFIVQCSDSHACMHVACHATRYLYSLIVTFACAPAALLLVLINQSPGGKLQIQNRLCTKMHMGFLHACACHKLLCTGLLPSVLCVVTQATLLVAFLTNLNVCSHVQAIIYR